MIASRLSPVISSCFQRGCANKKAAPLPDEITVNADIYYKRKGKPDFEYISDGGEFAFLPYTTLGEQTYSLFTDYDFFLIENGKRDTGFEKKGFKPITISNTVQVPLKPE